MADLALRVAGSTAPAVVGVPSKFMLDPATYAAGTAAGHEGMNFYVAGRGGALGDVDAAVVAQEFGVFEPGMVAAAWEISATVESRSAAAQRFADAAAAWAAEHLDPGALDYGRLAELAGAVLDRADLTGSGLAGGWTALAEPDTPPALALHRLNGLRELRFARHRDALDAGGVAPFDAVLVASPFMAGIFGWPEPHPEPDEAVRERWAAAEAETEQRFAADLSTLTEDELTEFESLCAALVRAAG